MQLLKPVMAKVHPVTMEEVKHSVQKEKRIIDTLEPVMNQHRLVVDRRLIEQDTSPRKPCRLSRPSVTNCSTR